MHACSGASLGMRVKSPLSLWLLLEPPSGLDPESGCCACIAGLIDAVVGAPTLPTPSLTLLVLAACPSQCAGARLAGVMLSAGVLPAVEQLFRQLPVVSPAHVTATILLVSAPSQYSQPHVAWQVCLHT